MMNKKFKIVAMTFIVFSVGFFTYNYVMTGGARDLEKEKAEFNTTSVVVFNEFSANSEMATTKYLNKAVEISGKVTNVNENVIMLDEKVSCQLLTLEKIEVNSQVKIKGRVTGYDDLLEELKLDQCLIVK